MNLINILFVQLTIVIVVLGTLMNLLERYLPTAIKQTFRYGKHAHKEKSDKLVELIEIPKAWFSHFYVFAIIWSFIWLVMAINVYFFDYQLHKYLAAYLDLSCGSDRKAESKKITLLIIFIYLFFYFSFSFFDTNSFGSDDTAVYPPLYRDQLSTNILEEK